MSSLNEKLREIGESCPRYGDMELVGAIAVDVVPSLLRAIRVLVEQRDAAHEQGEGNQLALEHQRQIEDTAVLAAMDAKETT